MNGRSPVPVGGTSRVLFFGTLVSALAFSVGLGLTVVDAAAAAAIAANVGTVTLLATPAVGLVVSALELRTSQRQTAWLAVGVLALLAIAVVVALLAR